MNRYIAGRWDDTNYNVYDRETNEAVGHPWGYQSLRDAEQAAETMNESSGTE